MIVVFSSLYVYLYVKVKVTILLTKTLFQIRFYTISELEQLKNSDGLDFYFRSVGSWDSAANSIKTVVASAVQC